MGTRGPKGNRRLRALEGNPGKKREPNAPKPAPVRPEKPPWLDARAGEIWDDLAPRAEATGVLTEVDGDSFGDFCTCLARLREAEQDISRRGVLVPGRRKGDQVKNPSCQMAREYRQAVVRWSDRFGFSPAARQSLDLPVVDDEDPMEQLLSQKGG